MGVDRQLQYAVGASNAAASGSPSEFCEQSVQKLAAPSLIPTTQCQEMSSWQV